jgi:hypothetical protein
MSDRKGQAEIPEVLEELRLEGGVLRPRGPGDDREQDHH